MRKNYIFFKSLLLATVLMLGSANAWGGEKTVVKYSFDDSSSPSLTAGSRVAFDYTRTSVITGTKFLNAYNSTNGDPGSSTILLGSTDLSSETWTLEFEWAACGGCNSKADHTTLKAGSNTLFDISGNSNWNTTVTLSYGESGTATLPVPGCDKSKRFSAAVGDQYNTTTYWHHFVITGSTAEGVKLTVTNSSSGTKVVNNVTLSETNVNPTSIIIEPCCGGAIGMDELHLYYYVAGEVIQTPTASYTNVNGDYRTVTASCETEGATLYYSTDQANWTAGSAYTTNVTETVYFKGVKSESESEILAFPITAGEIKLNSPVISRSGNTVTITSDQSNILLAPSATIYYTYGGGAPAVYTGAITVVEDETITAYASATGYTNSDVASRAVALFPADVVKVINAPSNTSYTTGGLSGVDVPGINTTYQAIILDGEQWGSEDIYVQTTDFNIRNNGSWYINSSTANVWVLVKNRVAGEILVFNNDFQASALTNATYSEKYSEGNRFAYIVEADGDVEIALKKINSSTMHYFYGIYAYSHSVSVTISSVGFATLFVSGALDFSGTGLEAYTATTDGTTVTPKKVENVPAETGVILKGTPGTYNIPAIASSSEEKGDLTGNAFAATAPDAFAGYDLYGLAAKGANEAEFRKVVDNAIPAGRAFLKLTSSGEAKVLRVVDGQTTEVVAPEVVETEEPEVLYNMAGIPVGKDFKGYVINQKGEKRLQR